MRSVVAVALFVLSLSASLQAARPKPVNVDATIDRGLAFLAKDALAWKRAAQLRLVPPCRPRDLGDA